MDEDKCKWGQCPPDKLEIGDILDRIRPDDVQREWIKNLRSGKHRQCIGYLRKKNIDGVFEYDALGLLCLTCEEMQIEHMSDEEWEAEQPPYRTLLTAGFKVRMGRDGKMQPCKEINVIEEVNDRGDTFSQIAYLLECRAEGMDIRRY